MSGAKVGYDIESRTPERALRFIEVKGRAKGATTVTVTKNEILTALNKPERFVLAVVLVDGDATETYYLREPFASPTSARRVRTTTSPTFSSAQNG